MSLLSTTRFANRADAGRQLASQLTHLKGPDVVVVGLPRGGMPVADEVSRALDAPLDVLIVRKLGLPFQPELAMGAIGEGGVRVVDEHLLADARVSAEELQEVERRQQHQLEARVRRYRRGRPPMSLAGRSVIVVDDGLATGSTARAACQVARRAGASRVVLAVPVAAADSLAQFDVADEVVAVATPQPFVAVGRFYRDFSPTSDDEVVTILDAAARRRNRSLADEADCDVEVEIPVGRLRLPGHLHAPDPARAIVVFAHGSGSSRDSPRNRYVADELYANGLGTLLLDLLTPEEERHRTNVFDITLLGRRLGAVTSWLAERPDTRDARVGYFGASTGAAAALWAAAQPGARVEAVVSRGGRPDLALDVLDQVRAPTLLIVGSHDPVVLDYNRMAQRRLVAPHELVVVDGASHLFEEPGTLAQAAEVAGAWFRHHLLDPVDELPGVRP